MRHIANLTSCGCPVTVMSVYVIGKTAYVKITVKDNDVVSDTADYAPENFGGEVVELEYRRIH
jgi:hypothetical protein